MSGPQSAALIRNRYFDELSATPGLYWLGQNTNHIESHPAVREAAVVGVADPVWGERPVALVVLTSGAVTTAEELKAHIAPHMPSWWRPDVLRFCAELPRTSVGKYDKKQIRAEWETTGGEKTL